MSITKQSADNIVPMLNRLRILSVRAEPSLPQTGQATLGGVDLLEPLKQHSQGRSNEDIYNEPIKKTAFLTGASKGLGMAFKNIPKALKSSFTKTPKSIPKSKAPSFMNKFNKGLATDMTDQQLKSLKRLRTIGTTGAMIAGGIYAGDKMYAADQASGNPMTTGSPMAGVTNTDWQSRQMRQSPHAAYFAQNPSYMPDTQPQNTNVQG